jgi:hypothetical protein
LRFRRLDDSQTDQSIGEFKLGEYGQRVFDDLERRRLKQEQAIRNARLDRIARGNGDSTHGVGIQDIAEVFVNNFLDLEGVLTGTAAFGQGATGNFSMELDGQSATGRIGHTTGLGLFAGFLVEGKTLSFGNLDGFNQSASFTIAPGPAIRFSMQWGPRGFQLTSAYGVGVGADLTIISNGFAAGIGEKK